MQTRPLSPPERAPADREGVQAGAPRTAGSAAAAHVLALRSAPPASQQTKVDEVLFKFQRQWLGSFAETITLLLGTNVDF